MYKSILKVLDFPSKSYSRQKMRDITSRSYCWSLNLLGTRCPGAATICSSVLQRKMSNRVNRGKICLLKGGNRFYPKLSWISSQLSNIIILYFLILNPNFTWYWRYQDSWSPTKFLNWSCLEWKLLWQSHIRLFWFASILLISVSSWLGYVVFKEI